MTCPNCKKEISDTATLCTSCGWKSQKWEACKQEGKNQYNGVIFAVVAIVALLAFFAIAVAVIV